VSDDPPSAGAPARRRRSALLWGLVGALTFLVLVQGYNLLGGRLPAGPAAIGAVAAVVWAGATAVAYVAEPRMARGKDRT